jgi:hypothetical protein
MPASQTVRTCRSMSDNFSNTQKKSLGARGAQAISLLLHRTWRRIRGSATARAVTQVVLRRLLAVAPDALAPAVVECRRAS